MSEVIPGSLSAVLDAFEPALKSIDVRTIAVRPVSQIAPWTNLITLIFISEKTIDEVEAEHKTLPQVKNEQFSVFLKVAPFSRDIFDEIQRGLITFATPNGFVKVESREADLLTMIAYSMPRRIKGISKLMLNVIGSDPSSERKTLWSVISGQNLEAKRQHYSDVSALIKDILVADFINIGDPRDFDVAVSSGAEIESADFAGASFKVKVKGASGLKGLQLNFALGRTNYYDPIWRGDARLEDGKKSRDDSDSIEVVVNPPSVLPFDQMYVELIHRSVPLNIGTSVAVAPLENVVEPFLKTFSAFCQLEDFKKMLFDPVNFSKQPQKIFENAVTWLLSLAGFHTINLGIEISTSKSKKRFDSLVAEESGVPIGSTDIIAYEDNKRLLLIDCDIGGVDDNKIDKLVEARKHFEALSKFEQFSFVSILCTPKECPTMTINGVVIAGRRVLEDILVNIAKGNWQTARDRLGVVGGLVGN
jgi:hypothetical protein